MLYNTIYRRTLDDLLLELRRRDDKQNGLLSRQELCHIFAAFGFYWLPSVAQDFLDCVVEQQNIHLVGSQNPGYPGTSSRRNLGNTRNFDHKLRSQLLYYEDIILAIKYELNHEQHMNEVLIHLKSRIRQQVREGMDITSIFEDMDYDSTGALDLNKYVSLCFIISVICSSI